MENKILAAVNGSNITEEDVINEIAALGERGKNLKDSTIAAHCPS